MKVFIKIFLTAAFLLSFLYNVSGQDTVVRYKRTLAPNYVNFQYAGNYGTYIIGAGYYLNKKQSLDLVFGYGYSPKNVAGFNIQNIFIKSMYLPVNWKLKHSWSLAPQMGVSISRWFSGGTNTFARLPSYYYDGYYAPNAYRFHVNFGGRVRKAIGDDTFVKAIDFYIETTSNDLNLYYFFKSPDVGFTRIWSMAVGVNLVLFNKN